MALAMATGMPWASPLDTNCCAQMPVYRQNQETCHLTNSVGRDVKWARQHSVLQLLCTAPDLIQLGDIWMREHEMEMPPESLHVARQTDVQ